MFRTLQAAGHGNRPLDALNQLIFVQIQRGDTGIHRQNQFTALHSLADLAQRQPGIHNRADHLPRFQQFPNGLGPYRLLSKAAERLAFALDLHKIAGAVQVLQKRHRSVTAHLGLGQQFQFDVHFPAVRRVLLAAEGGDLHFHLTVPLAVGPRRLHSLGEGQ